MRSSAFHRFLPLLFLVPAAFAADGSSLAPAATLMPERSVEVGLEVAGIVEEVPVSEGGRVSGGDVILRLRATLQTLALEEAQLELRRETIRRDHLVAKAERMETMVAENLVSREEYEDARTQAGMARAGADLAANRVEARRAEVEQRVLTAPWDGFVLRVAAREGEIVKPFDPLAEVADPSRLKAVFFLTPSMVPADPGPDTWRLLAAGKDSAIPFEVGGIDPFPDPSTERIRLILLVNPSEEVRSGDRVVLEKTDPGQG